MPPSESISEGMLNRVSGSSVSCEYSMDNSESVCHRSFRSSGSCVRLVCDVSMSESSGVCGCKTLSGNTVMLARVIKTAITEMALSISQAWISEGSWSTGQ